jgi:hypothetical protein
MEENFTGCQDQVNSTSPVRNVSISFTQMHLHEQLLFRTHAQKWELKGHQLNTVDEATPLEETPDRKRALPEPAVIAVVVKPVKKQKRTRKPSWKRCPDEKESTDAATAALVTNRRMNFTITVRPTARELERELSRKAMICPVLPAANYNPAIYGATQLNQQDNNGVFIKAERKQHESPTRRRKGPTCRPSAAEQQLKGPPCRASAAELKQALMGSLKGPPCRASAAELKQALMGSLKGPPCRASAAELRAQREQERQRLATHMG